MSNFFDVAKEIYGKYGVDAENALEQLKNIPLSMHCWQGDDVGGFETSNGGSGGGIMSTGNYPGKARNPQELMQDMSKSLSLIPGKHRINLHASYAVTDGANVERDELKPKHFDAWIEYAKTNGLGIDFNPTFFGHSKVKDNLTLSSPDEETRQFWVRHGKACRAISSHIAQKLGKPVLYNLWIPDGFKDIPADRLSPRLRLKKSLDEIFEEKFDNVIDCVESKVFGIGLESFTVGSNEFYLGYAANRKNVYNLLDNGHFHPTENVADKIASLLCYFDKIPLHVTRPVRWDSDHVVLFDETAKEICAEIVRNNATEKVLIGLDFFDGSINRIAAWVIGMRNTQKCLLDALLKPWQRLSTLQNSGQFTELLMLQEELKTLPMGAVWQEFCERNNVPSDEKWYDEVKTYEKNVLFKRN